MKQKDVVVGNTYLTYIGTTLSRVVVVQIREPIPGYDRSRCARYVVRRENEERSLPKFRTAAALRPLHTSKQSDTPDRTLNGEVADCLSEPTYNE